MASTTVYGEGLAVSVRVNLTPEEAGELVRALDCSPVRSGLVAWLSCSLTEFARTGAVSRAEVGE